MPAGCAPRWELVVRVLSTTPCGCNSRLARALEVTTRKGDVYPTTGVDISSRLPTASKWLPRLQPHWPPFWLSSRRRRLGHCNPFHRRWPVAPATKEQNHSFKIARRLILDQNGHKHELCTQDRTSLPTHQKHCQFVKFTPLRSVYHQNRALLSCRSGCAV